MECNGDSARNGHTLDLVRDPPLFLQQHQLLHDLVQLDHLHRPRLRAHIFTVPHIDRPAVEFFLPDNYIMAALSNMLLTF